MIQDSAITVLGLAIVTVSIAYRVVTDRIKRELARVRVPQAVARWRR